MNKIALLILVLVVVGLGFAAYHEDSDYGMRPKITDIENHNQQMNECIKTALELHPGAILETEVETEDGKLITDVDIQGADGNSWEVECELATGKIVEDKQEH
jgi:uncharacterized membrane protein YkoI